MFCQLVKNNDIVIVRVYRVFYELIIIILYNVLYTARTNLFYKLLRSLMINVSIYVIYFYFFPNIEIQLLTLIYIL